MILYPDLFHRKVSADSKDIYSNEGVQRNAITSLTLRTIPP